MTLKISKVGDLWQEGGERPFDTSPEGGSGGEIVNSPGEAFPGELDPYKENEKSAARREP